MTVSGAAFKLAGWLLLAGAAIHVAAYLGGPSWLFFLGAPTSVVQSAAHGTWLALAGTLVIATFLTVVALYCFSSVYIVRKLPLRRTLLLFSAALFTVRGLLLVPFLLAGQRRWSTPVADLHVTGSLFALGSFVVLTIGALIALGLVTSAGCGGRQDGTSATPLS